MATRTFGPIKGAGVSVTERGTIPQITPASLGWAAYSGILERGRPDELILALTRTELEQQTGNLIPESTLPDVTRDYFDLANGAGGLGLVRVTDGTELQAELNLYARRADLLTLVGKIKADNGGRWAGFYDRATDQVADEVVDITATTVTTGVTTWNTDQWAGATLELAGVSNKSYVVVGNTSAGVISVSSDSDMADDLLNGGDATNDRWFLELDSRSDRGIEVRIGDGELDPDNGFSLDVIDDGVEIIRWAQLSMDPNDPEYWVDVINESSANYYIIAEDLWTGAITPDIRPANIYGNVLTLTATVLTAEIADFSINSPTFGNPTFLLGATSDEHLAQTITITMTAATTGDAVSDKFGALGVVTLGVLFDPGAAVDGVKWVPPFTVTAGAPPLVAADTLVIQYKPLGAVNSLVDSFVLPDKVANGDKVYRITANDHKSITVGPGNDMATDVAGGDDDFMVITAQKLEAGRDGHADVDDNDYTIVYDKDNSLFNRLKNRGLGLVKFAAPGVTSTAVQKAGAEYVSSLAAGYHQWRYEVPIGITTSTAIETHVNSVLGRSPFGDYVTIAQGFCKVVDPEAASKLKTIPTVGMIHGREASFAATYQGFHRPAAGTSATLPRVVELNTGESVLNEEFLNPRGVNVIRIRNGDAIIWGIRTVTSNSAWRFKGVRETFSYYSNVLAENFDASIFETNDPRLWSRIRTQLLGFFRNEYAIGALDNTFSFKDALNIKIDAENNTPVTQANGDVNVDITVRIVNAAERIKFSIGKGGIQTSGA